MDLKMLLYIMVFYYLIIIQTTRFLNDKYV